MLYRVIYYLLPLVLAAVLLAAYEVRAGIAAPIGRAAVRLSPMLLATMTFIAGGWLLVSGVTPVSAQATDMLALRVPLTLVEASHFLGSVTGFAMIVIARGLLHRLDAAWWAAFVLALVAAVLAMPKGFALGTSGATSWCWRFCCISRERQFDRRSALFSNPLRGVWLISVVWMVGATVFLLFFAYRRVDYTNELWWQLRIQCQRAAFVARDDGRDGCRLGHRALAVVAAITGRAGVAVHRRAGSGEQHRAHAAFSRSKSRADGRQASAVLHPGQCFHHVRPARPLVDFVVRSGRAGRRSGRS